MKAEEEQNDDEVIMKRGGGTEKDGPVVGAMSVRVLRLLCCGNGSSHCVIMQDYPFKQTVSTSEWSELDSRLFL